MEYKVNWTLGYVHKTWDATPTIVIGAHSAQSAVDLIGARGFFKSIDRVQSRECDGMPWIDCVDWTQPSIEARNAGAIVEISPCEQ